MKVGNDGSFHFCRWGENNKSTSNIKNTHPVTWFQNSTEQKILRQGMINGVQNLDCHGCYTMESHGKISGRQRQLLKTGIQLDQFDKTLLSSPWLSVFKRSENGDTDQVPLDWQIDLGNFCNSACVFCVPESSSRLASELHKLKIIDSLPEENWSKNTNQLEKLLDALEKANNTNSLRYLHFIGGETLIIPAFKSILQKITTPTTLGFTTNLTVWDEEIIDLLSPHNVHLGVSLETVSLLNDYIRWGSRLEQVLENLSRWQTVAQQRNWILSLRITPTALSIGELDSVYEYAWQNNLLVESCNFIHEPAFLRPSVLPLSLRLQARHRLASWIKNKNTEQDHTVINTRDTNKTKQVLLQDARSYISYLNTARDETSLLPRLVDYINKLETSRNNCILDYLPQYADTLRSHGYAK
jgi:sulfatase maturation enzyme AslB (radical SAM superfamily)